MRSVGSAVWSCLPASMQHYAAGSHRRLSCFFNMDLADDRPPITFRGFRQIQLKRKTAGDANLQRTAAYLQGEMTKQPIQPTS